MSWNHSTPVDHVRSFNSVSRVKRLNAVTVKKSFESENKLNHLREENDRESEHVDECKINTIIEENDVGQTEWNVKVKEGKQRIQSGKKTKKVHPHLDQDSAH